MSAEDFDDADDREALALARCYALARERARQLREQKAMLAVSRGGDAASIAKQGDQEGRPTYVKE
jgi:hypothetical protein